MKEKIFKNFSLKVLSVVCAIILWTIIVNVNDPNTGYTFSNVSVQLINTDSLTNKGYTFEIVDGGKISVYVSGPKSVVTDLKASDIVATADLSKITEFAEYADINVQIIKDGQVRTDVEALPKTSAVKLNIDNRISQTFNVNIENTGDLAEGYSIVAQTISPNTVRITGSSAVVSAIDTVKAVVDVNGFYGDITQTVPITLSDIDGNVLPLDGLDLSRTEVDYSAQIQQTKQVPVKYSLSGAVAEGYSIEGVQLNQEEVLLAGSSHLLDTIHEIMIPAEQLNISNLTADKTYTIDIANLVPQGVVAVSSKNILVNVKVSSRYSREMDIEATQIQFNNLSSSLNAEITAASLRVTLQGKESTVDALQPSDIKLYVDLSGLTEGTHSLPVTVSLPTGVTVSGSYTVEVTITSQEQGTSGGQQTTAS